MTHAPDPFERLHPALQYHVVNSLGWSSMRPTQLQAIKPIHAGLHALLLAPTAGGKTEAAIIPILSRMLGENWPGTSVLYVCPIKALLNNLEQRLSHYAGLVGRRVEVWHGDVSQSRKTKALHEPPDILLTTPESIEGMLVSTRVNRQRWFGNVRAVIVDELHAFAGDDRGWHLRALLQRIGRYTDGPPQRIGLSATVSNPQALLAWFAPTGERGIVGSAGVSTDADVTIDHVGSLDNAATVVSRLDRGMKRLVFCDSRSQAERLASELRALGVRTFLSHGSLSASERKQAEAAFAEERDCVIVATSTLELGIDVGDLDRVIQIDAPATVSSFLQRMGRTGRRSGSRRNCLFLTTTDEAFLQALGVTKQWSRAWVEAVVPPPEPWPVVAQQVMVSLLEQGVVVRMELLESLGQGFTELPAARIETLVEHMLGAGFAVESGGVLQLGQATEAEFGRSHYRDLLASFSGAPLLLGRHGATEIGYIDPSVLIGHDAATRLLLGGRSWLVTSVEWSRKTAWLEPVKEGGKARWTGAARTVGPEVCQAIRDVLAEGTLPGVQLSRRARAHLDLLRDEIPCGLMSRQPGPGSTHRWWTFAGTVANRTLARRIGSLNSRAFDALSVLTTTSTDVSAGAADTAPVMLTDEEVADLASGIKFGNCLPVGLLRRTVMARNFNG
ncbi:DEAD/DEAH box helicase [Azohydromonas australica]|uniref:DEAD/DEAH box helicase n=1 Tax=Azohydromonas australica TaxID=364039 RepID=UPI0003FE7A27|nr:DEAD/DEAH box helicase [Azohydromonas australica]